jgi:hypothetical protein
MATCWRCGPSSPPAKRPREGTFARRYITGAGWQPPVRVAQAGGTPTLNTTLAVGTDGSITAGWVQPDAYRSDGQVWINMLK